MYIPPDYFQIYELVPPALFHRVGTQGWEYFDENALITLYELRLEYGYMKINDYYWEGKREWSGLRNSTSPYYWRDSFHNVGKAFDVIFMETTADKVRKDLFRNPNKNCFRRITGLELGVSWFHFETANRNELKTFYPKK